MTIKPAVMPTFFFLFFINKYMVLFSFFFPLSNRRYFSICAKRKITQSYLLKGKFWCVNWKLLKLRFFPLKQSLTLLYEPLTISLRKHFLKLRHEYMNACICMLQCHYTYKPTRLLSFDSKVNCYNHSILPSRSFTSYT